MRRCSRNDTSVEGRGIARAEFTEHAGQRVPFVLMWHPSHEATPRPVKGLDAVAVKDAWWREWCSVLLRRSTAR
jgi:hypothetical protein